MKLHCREHWFAQDFLFFFCCTQRHRHQQSRSPQKQCSHRSLEHWQTTVEWACDCRVSMRVNECVSVHACMHACVCVYAKYMAKALHELWLIIGEGGHKHPSVQWSGADMKGPHTQATSSPRGARNRETTQPIRGKPCPSPEDRRGRPQVEPPWPLSKEAREPGATGQGTARHRPSSMSRVRDQEPREHLHLP